MATAICRCLAVAVAAGVALMVAATTTVEAQPNYADALTKSILFFEGQRSGKLPSNQRMTWRGDSALRDGVDVHVDLVGGYYDAGDNVKFNFPMAFTTTMLAWSLLDFGQFMGASDEGHAVDALRWGTDYLLKATSIPGCVFVQVGNPYSDHDCWERPEDMDTLRTSYAVTKNNPGSEVSAEIAAALAASSMVFQVFDRPYAARLRNRAVSVFDFADKYRGSFNTSLGQWVCPFYCDFSGYQDELIWGALWLHRSTRASYYWNYVSSNIQNLEPTTGGTSYQGGSYTEFGWDSKHAGIYVLIDKLAAKNPTYYSSPASAYAEKFICTLLPESPTKFASFSPGGLMFKSGGSNLQHATALSFLMIVYARQLSHAKSVAHCGNVVATPRRIARLAQSQVDYILGSNPLKMSYMVGYGNKFPLYIHHRGSSLPSVANNPQQLSCQGGSPYFASPNPNPNLLVGAVVGGPSNDDSYQDSRANFVQSEPTTYINAPFVGVLAFFKAHDHM